MKRKAALALLFLAACGGNYSNGDVEFIGALPVRHELESKLPQPTGQALEGVRQDAIAVGEPSQAYLDTQSATASFNGGLFGLLDLIDKIRVIPPTHRDLDRRIWGPFPDEHNTNFLVEVVMERVQSVVFTYRIEVRSKDAPASAPWTSLVVGTFHGTGGARRGIGEVQLLAQAVRDVGFAVQGLDQVDTLEMSYRSDQSLVEVNMLFRGTSTAAFQIVTYGYREFADGQGAMQFIATRNNLVLSETSRWRSSGQGRTDSAVSAGAYFGAQGIECWDAQFLVTYSNKSWENPTLVGNPGNCAF